jgi:glycosyltransferase involved in cell wall biosynthesis
MPRVSVGLPVYNGERYLSEALDSLIAQTFDNFELIICDNASTDQTEQICRSYLDGDKRIRYFRNETNLGAAKNYRRTFELSSGQYFRWANHDDLSGPEFLARCVEVLDREPSVILTYPKTKLIDERGQAISEYQDGLNLQSPKASDRFSQLFQRLGLCNAVYGLIRSEVLKRTALIGPYIASDGPLLAELTLYGKFWEVPEFLFYRRLHPGAWSSCKDVSKQLEFYDPKIKHRIAMTNWRHLWANFRAVKRAPLDIAEKMRLRRYLVRVGIWRRRDLLTELYSTVGQTIRRGVHNKHFSTKWFAKLPQ